MTAKKTLTAFFTAANKILDDRKAAELAEQQRQAEIERQKRARAREIVREDRALKAEQSALFATEFEPALKKLSALQKGGLFTYAVQTDSHGFNSDLGRDTPLLNFAITATEPNRSMLVKLWSKDVLEYSFNGGSYYTTASVEGVSGMMAEFTLKWAPEQVEALARREKRAAKPAPRPKR